MPKTVHMLSAGLLAASAAGAAAQSVATPAAPPAHPVALAVTYAAQRELVTGSGQSFWMQGGEAEVDVEAYRGLHAIAALEGSTVASTPTQVAGGSGAGLSLLTYVAGPRFTFPLGRSGHRPMIFAQSLFGAAHGFDAVFPSHGNIVPSATAFALTAGGGVDLALNHWVRLRALDAEFTHSALTNGAGDSENGIRLSAGVVFTFAHGR